MNDITPGWKTTEFYLALAPWLLALVVLILLGVGAVDGNLAVAILAALGIGGGISSAKYSEARARVKASSPIFVEELEAGG